MKTYDEIREDLTRFYFDELPALAEGTRERVFARMDGYDAAHPGLSAYRLKAQLYRTIAEEISPAVFPGLDFPFETGALVAYSDGKFNRGAIHANGWLYLRNRHLFRDADPHAHDLFLKNRDAVLYCQTGEYVDVMHVGLPLKKLFRVGLDGILGETEAALAGAGTEEEREFLLCAAEGIRSMELVAEKFSGAAREKGMEALSETARRVPRQPPRTFHEGLCVLAFMRKVLGAMEGIGYNSFGRADVLLGPLAEADLARGVSREELLDDVCRFLLIWDSALDRRRPMTGNLDYELENTMTLGGTDAEGRVVWNEATRLFLDARDRVESLYPKMMLRFSAASPREVLERFTRPLLEGKSYSLFENDDAILPALKAAGVTEEDAADLAVGGCWDALTPDLNLRFSGEYVSVLRPMEWVIHNKTREMEENELQFGPLEDAESFEALYRAYLEDLRKVLLRKAVPMARGAREWHRVNPASLTSALMEPCVPKRRDVTAGGGKYNWECVYLTGFPEAVDSLLAIRKLCFEDRVCSVPRLFEACRENWRDEVLRARAIAAPSYGDGSETSTGMASRLFRDLYEMTRDLPTAYGGQFRLGCNLYTEVLWLGKLTLATPNGRRSGDYLSQGLSPSRLQAPVSAFEILESVAGLDLPALSAGNASMTVTLPAGKISADQMIDFFRAAARCGVQGLQVNCVDREELLRAQKDPEHYRHIIVRVCGFSAPFVLLSREYQEEFLSRMISEA